MPWITPSDPRMNPGYVSSQADIHGQSVSPGLIPKNQMLEALQQAAPLLAQYLRKKNADDVANELLKQSGAPDQLQGKGSDALQMWNQYQNNQPDSAMDDVNYQRAYRQAYPDQFPQASATPKPMTEYQRQHLDMQQRREDRLGAGGGTKQHKVDYSDIKAQTGHAWSEWNQLSQNDLKNIGTDPTDPNQLRATFPDGTSATIPSQLFQEAQKRGQKANYPGGAVPQSSVDQVQQAATDTTNAVPSRGALMQQSKPAMSKENPTLTDKQQELFQWATSHKNDPRSAAILQKLGIQ